MIKLFLLASFLYQSPSDSLGLETINGKQFIIHQIESKETLYSISRRYGVPVTIILENNPASDGGLAVGQLLKVPFTPKPKIVSSGGSKHVVAAKETLFSISKQYNVSVDELKAWNNLTDNSLALGQELIVSKRVSPTTVTTVAPLKSVSSTHIVGTKETMYSIARQYSVTIEQLKQWNSLSTDELKVGQLLIVIQPKYQTTTIPTEVRQTAQVVKEPLVVKEPAIASAQPSIMPIKIFEKVIGTDEIKEGGSAELIEGTDGNRKYLALHRTAKMGSILKVRNEQNNREVFVRVMGSLPGEVSSDVVIRISKSAYDRLGAADPKFKVEVIYYK